MSSWIDDFPKVDASVVPIHISAHTQATVYAIAEKVRCPFEDYDGAVANRCSRLLILSGRN